MPVDPCGRIKNEATCDTLPDECVWYDSLNQPKPVFSEEFCHPAGLFKDTTKAQWDSCVHHDADSCVAPCDWSNGAKDYPTEDFCGPEFMTNDTIVIENCFSSLSKEDCSTKGPKCMWRSGKIEANNDDFVVDGELFDVNFCHAPTTARWNETLPVCSALRTRD
jgi:hypothetical protein